MKLWLGVVQYLGKVDEWNALISVGRIGANTFGNTKVTQIICNGGTTPF